MPVLSEAAESITISTVGDGPVVVAFLHGLMGRGKNFTRFAKDLSAQYTSLLVDLPNHGTSGWTDEFSYEDMADTVAEALRAKAGDRKIMLVGHSMGGKVAMLIALRHPELIERLMVVDISPGRSWEGGGVFPHLLGSLRELDLANVENRGDADAKLAEAIPEDSVRLFLLQNLRYSDGAWGWQPNLELLYQSLEEIGGFPVTNQSFDGPVLWVAGSKSDYVSEAKLPLMSQLFPRVELRTVQGAGHWVHSEKPEEFEQLLQELID
ncbi:MAG: alpha/beta hydrolase [Kocuria palustris]|nr:MAG: alpha/beta hydrolase [Kocuria palustris]